MRTTLLSLLLGLTCAAFAEDKPACNFRALTRDCKFYDEHKEQLRFKLPDGTFIINPRYDAMLALEKDDAGNPSEPPSPHLSPQEIMAKILKSQARTIAILGSLPAKVRVSDEFKVAFNSVAFSPAVRAWTKGKTANSRAVESGRFSLPWPPGQSDAEIKEVSGRDLVRFLDGLPQPQRERLKNNLADTPVPQFLGGMGFGGAGASDSAPKTKAATPAQQKRIDEAFVYAKNAMLEEISKGRPLDKLSPAERSEYDRVASVTFSPLAKSQSEPMCLTGGANAFYNPRGHIIHVCAGNFNEPFASLVQMFGHEMAHSFDPCSGRNYLLTVDREKLWSLKGLPVANWPDQIRNDPELTNILTSMIGSEGKYFGLTESIFLDDERIVKRLKELGIADVAAPAIGAGEQDPTFAAQQCIQRTTNIRVISDAQIDSLAEEYTRVVRAKHPGISDGYDRREKARTKMKQYPNCLQGPLGKSQLAETMADAWGAKVMGRWLAQNPPASELERIAAVAYHGGALCMKNQPEPGAAESLLTIDQVIKSDANEVHPDFDDRANQIILTEPRVQAALNCSPDPKLNCLSMIGTNGPVPAPSKPEPAASGVTR